MKVTDELREYALGWDKENRVRHDLVAIADRIDAEHEKAMDEWKAKAGQSWLQGYGECHAELMEGNEVIAPSLEEAGWVKLPVDADGVPIRVGDVMTVRVGDVMTDGEYTFTVNELAYSGSWSICSEDDVVVGIVRHNPLPKNNIEDVREVDRLQVENAKLRELVLDYFNAPCLECNPWAEGWEGCKHCESGNCTLAVRTLELGIEVDG